MTTNAREPALIETGRPRIGRTFAMVLAGAGCWMLAAGVASFLAYAVVIYAPSIGDGRFVAVVLPVFGLVTAILLLAGGLAVRWVPARGRPWSWLIPVILAALVLAANAQDIPYDLARPANTVPFLITIVVLTGALAAVCGGIAAIVEVRRGRPVWDRSGRVGWASGAVIGVLLGAAGASLLAGLATAGGPGGARVPTESGVIRIDGTRFVESSLEMRDGTVLGLFVANPEDVWHTFDIDSLGVHVQLAPNTTTAVVIQPTGRGQLVFYCSVHGHRAAGMAGTITVN